MKKILSLSAAFAAVLAAPVNAQFTTDPVGFVSVTVPAASDAALGAPLGRPSEYVGDKAIQSISGNVITVSNNSTWTTNQWVYVNPVSPGVPSTQPKTYFARIDSGLKEGLICTITANTANTLTVTLPAGEDLTTIKTIDVDGIANADSISIAPYWTISTLVSGGIAGTQVQMISTVTAGINLPVTTYTFNGTNWIKGSSVSNDDVIGVGQGVIVRNNSTTTALTLSITGAVPMTGHRMVLATLAGNTKQDIRIFYNSPVPEIIGNVFNVGSLIAGDQFLHSDNVPTGKNKALTTLTWNGTNWIQGSTVVTTTFSLQPGSSYIFRKNKSTNPASVVWSDLQSYLQ